MARAATAASQTLALHPLRGTGKGLLPGRVRLLRLLLPEERLLPLHAAGLPDEPRSARVSAKSDAGRDRPVPVLHLQGPGRLLLPEVIFSHGRDAALAAVIRATGRCRHCSP